MLGRRLLLAAIQRSSFIHHHHHQCIISVPSIPCHSFSTRPSNRRQKGGRRWSVPAVPSHPPLQNTLRKFYLKVHPDLFTHFPEEKNINQESFSRFQAFLDEIRDKNTAPPRAGLHQYKFYLKTKEDGKFQEVSLEVRTTGGDCRNVVQRSLESFFLQCGLPEKFSWAEGDWAYSIEVERVEREEEA